MNTRAVCLLLAVLVTSCVSAEFRQHYDAGAAAADSGDFDVAIAELEAAIAIDPDVSSLAWHKLAYCYQKTGRQRDAWVAMRKAVILNPMSSERKQGFYAIWGAMKADLSLGSSTTDVRRHLGDPDVEAGGTDSALWTYGLVALEFEGGNLAAINDS